MDIRRDPLLDPPFAKDPPVKLNVPAKTFGLVCAILGGIGALFGLFAIFGLLGLSAIAASVGAFAGIFWLAVLGAIITEVGTILAAWGGYQMYQGRRDGKRLLVYGLIVNVVGSLLNSLGSGAMSDLSDRTEREEEEFLREVFVALEADARALAPSLGTAPMAAPEGEKTNAADPKASGVPTSSMTRDD